METQIPKGHDQLKGANRPLPLARLLRPRDVAEILQVHPSTVYRLARRGAIKCVTIPPKTLRFEASDIEEFIKRCRNSKRPTGSPLTSAPTPAMISLIQPERR